MTPRLNYGYVGPQWATLFENASLGDHLAGRNILSAQLAWTHAHFVTTLVRHQRDRPTLRRGPQFRSAFRRVSASIRHAVPDDLLRRTTGRPAIKKPAAVLFTLT